MSYARALEKLAADPVKLALAAGIALVVVYLVGRQAIKETVGAVGDFAGGVISGNNVVTRGTAFEGTGVVGTLAAGVNAASGGLLEKAGSSIGGWLFDLLNEDANLASDRRAAQILASRTPTQPADKPTALLRR